MPNFFDQFDAPPAASPATPPNFFDQFDAPPAETPGVVGAVGNALRRGGLNVKAGAQEYAAGKLSQTSGDVGRGFGDILSDQSGPDGFPGPFDLLTAGARYLASRTITGPDAAAAAAGYRGGAAAAQREAAAIPRSAPAARAAGRFAQIDPNQSYLGQGMDTLGAIFGSPLDTAALVGETAIESVPTMAAGVAAGALTRSPAVGAAVMGAASGAQERYTSPLDFFASRGLDLSTPEGVQASLDPAIMAEAEKYGFTRGAIIGALDAISGGVAARQLGKTAIGNFGKQALVQGALGGGGEAGAQIANNERVNIGSVTLEALAEFASAPAEVVGIGRQYLSRKGKTAADVSVDEIRADAAAGDPEAEAILRAAGVTDEQLGVMSPDDRTRFADRVAARRAQDAERAGQPLGDILEQAPTSDPRLAAQQVDKEIAARLAERERLKAEDDAVLAGEMDPGFRSTAGRQPGLERPIYLGQQDPTPGTTVVPVGPERVSVGQPDTEIQTAMGTDTARRNQMRADAEKAFSLARKMEERGRTDGTKGGQKQQEAQAKVNATPLAPTGPEDRIPRMAPDEIARAQAGIRQPAPQPDVGTLYGGETRQPGTADQAPARFPSAVVPTEPQPTRMTPDEVARAQAEIRGGNRNTAAPPGEVFGGEGRAPQTRDDVQGQREASQAFDLADRQRERASPTNRDTRPGGRPEGGVESQQDVYLDEGYPVRVLKEDVITDSKGRQKVMAEVERYDPRTGVTEGDTYVVDKSKLDSGAYAQDPRASQEFEVAARSPGTYDPRTGKSTNRADDALGLDRQTYRTTPEDVDPATGTRAFRPEQGAGPSSEGTGRGTNQRKPFTSAEEAMRDFRARAAQEDTARAERSARAESDNRPTSSKAAERDGSFDVDEGGFVRSDKGGPVKFGDQLQAGKALLALQRKSASGQFFEIANHPSGKGFTIREIGRSKPQARTEAQAAKSDAGAEEARRRANDPRTYPYERKDSAVDDGGQTRLPPPPPAPPSKRRERDIFGDAPQPRGILNFVRAYGGARPKEVEGLGLGRRPGLTNNKGKSIDRIREAAAQDGYFNEKYGTAENAVEKSTPDDLRELIRAELAGKRAMSQSDRDALAEYEAQSGGESAADRADRNERDVESALDSYAMETPISPRVRELIKAKMMDRGTTDGVGEIHDEVDRELARSADETPGGAGTLGRRSKLEDDTDIGSTFYSNPLDPALIGKLFGAPARALLARLKANTKLAEFLDEDLAAIASWAKSNLRLGQKKPDPGTVSRDTVNGLSKIYTTYDTQMRKVADALGNPPSLIRVLDMIWSPAFKPSTSEGSSLDEGITMKVGQTMTKLGEITHGLTPDEKRAVVASMRSGKSGATAKIREAVAALRAHLDAELAYLRRSGVDIGEVRRNYFPREYDKDKIQANMPAFVKAAARAYLQSGEAKSLSEATAKAEALADALVFGDPDAAIHDTKGKQASFFRSRVFDESADRLLADFMADDLDHIMARYTVRAAKRAEVATRFGDGLSKLSGMLDDVGRADKTRVVADVSQYIKTVAGIQGKTGFDPGTKAMAALSWTHTAGTMALLEQSVLTSLPEVLMPAIRSGNMGDAIGALGQAVGSAFAKVPLFGKIMDAVPAHARKIAARHLAEDLGLISGDAVTSLQMARLAGGNMESRIQSKILASYFRAIYMEQFTNFTRTLGVNTGTRYLHRMAQAVQGRRTWMSAGEGAKQLGILGVPREKQAAFASFVSKLDGRVATPEQVQAAGDIGRLYRAAMFRFVDQSIMRPNAATRPAWASTGIGRIVFALQSYGYAFFKNVLRRQGANVVNALNPRSGLEIKDRIAAMGNVAMLSLLVMAQYGLSELRDWMDERITGTEKRPMTFIAKLERAWSRAGLSGAADPFIQMISGTRYNRSIAQQTAGPVLGGAFDMLDAAANYFTRNSENTNAAERKAVGLGYSNLAEPFVAWLASRTMPNAMAFAAIQAARYGKGAFLDSTAPVEKSWRDYTPTTGITETLAGVKPKPEKTASRAAEIAASKRRVAEALR